MAPMTGDIPVSTALNDRANFRYSCSIRVDENCVGDKKLSQFFPRGEKSGFFSEYHVESVVTFFIRKTSYIELSLILSL